MRTRTRIAPTRRQGLVRLEAGLALRLRTSYRALAGRGIAVCHSVIFWRLSEGFVQPCHAGIGKIMV